MTMPDDQNTENKQSDTPASAAASRSSEADGLQERPRRMRSLKKGKILFQKGLRSIPCIVRNLSENGAKLEFEQAFLLPQQFTLQIDLEDFEATCERRWEDGLTCGVEFIGQKRAVSKQRSQVLKSSEQALREDIDALQDSPYNFFSRKRLMDQKASQTPDQPVRRSRPAGGSKPGFGKRR